MDKRNGSGVVIGVVSFFVLLFVFTKLIGPIPFAINSVNTNTTDLFQANGTGKVAVAPDSAKITVGITQSSSSVIEVQNKANSKANNIISALIKTGVAKKDIKTTNYSISPNYSFDNSQKVNGYSVTQTLEVKTDISKLNQAIDAATLSGANIIGGVEFSLNDTKQLAAENKARKEAVKNAKEKAEGLANAAGIKLGRIVNVVETEPGVVRPLLLQAKTDQATNNTETNITPGQNNIEINVTLTYQTL